MEAAAHPNNWNNHSLAWEYLLPERRMTRRIDTLEVHSQQWGLKSMELDVAFPESCSDPQAPKKDAFCLVPVAYIPKRPVASDLEIRDASDGIVSFPTRRECMALTKQAIELISSEAPKLLSRNADEYKLTSELSIRIGEVVEWEPVRARIARLDAGKNMIDTGHPRLKDWLLPLLRRLEESYILWAPLRGSPRSEHHLTVRRSDVRDGEPTLKVVRKPPEYFTIPSRAKDLEGEWQPPRKWRRRLNVSAFVRRLLVFFGLMTLKFEQEVLEADWSSSYHLRLVPPPGLIIRGVKVGRIDESQWGRKRPQVKPIKSATDRTIHGEGRRVGHAHLEMDPNPRWLTSQFTIGLRPGTTTLWSSVVVLTAALIWAMHNEVIRLLGLEPGGEMEEVEIQIAAAVLLVGPTFAAAWALRLQDATLIRNMLAGTQIVLMLSSMLSIATALLLAGITPFGWEPAKTVEWYASCSYILAILSMIGWLQAPNSIWLIYRRLLDRNWKNLVGVIALGLLSWLALQELTEWPGLLAGALLATGLGTALIAANRICVRLGESTFWLTTVATVGALVPLALASRELEFFNRVADRSTTHQYGSYLELAVAAAGFLVLLIRGIGCYRAGHPSNSQKQTSTPDG